MNRLVLILTFILLLSACDLLRFHPYQELDQYDEGLTQQNIQLIEKCTNTFDTISFAFISDTQRHYDDVHECVDYINRHSEIQFVLIGGDITDFGATDEFKWITEELNRLNKPWFTVIGNHDFLGLGEHNFLKVFGTYNFSFNVGHLHIVGLNTIYRDSENGLKTPDFDFLQNDFSYVSYLNGKYKDSIRQTVFVMHNMPGDEQFCNDEFLHFQNVLHQYPGLSCDSEVLTKDQIQQIADNKSSDGVLSDEDQSSMLNTRSMGFCLTGHTHHHGLIQPYADSTLFYSIDDIHKREIMLFTIYPDYYAVESIRF